MRGDGPGDGLSGADGPQRHSDDLTQETVTRQSRIDKGNAGYGDGRDGDDGDLQGDSKPDPEDARRLLADPPGWLQNQMAHCRDQGCSTNQLEALGAAVAAHLCGTPTRRAEILPEVEAFMTHGVGCDCGECP
jgi:hypothetical protein